jgi:putative membrane protein
MTRAGRRAPAVMLPMCLYARISRTSPYPPPGNLKRSPDALRPAVRDPWSWAALALVAGLLAAYLRGLSSPLAERDTLCAIAGLAVAAAAVSPPAHDLAERGLTLHMAQHVALVIAAAPLIVLGKPLSAVRDGLPGAARPLVARLARALPWTLGSSGIWIVTGVHAATFWLWHDPALYDAAVRHGSLHALEHASFLLTALVYWWTIVHAEDAGERGYVLAMVASVATVVQGSVLGLLMLVAHAPWYAVYAGSSDALSQQQAAAALMWGTTGSVYMLATAMLLWRLLAHLDLRSG